MNEDGEAIRVYAFNFLFISEVCNFHFTYNPSCSWILKGTAFLHLKLPRKLQSLSFSVGFGIDSPFFCNPEALQDELLYQLQKKAAW